VSRRPRGGRGYDQQGDTGTLDADRGHGDLQGVPDDRGAEGCGPGSAELQHRLYRLLESHPGKARRNRPKPTAAQLKGKCRQKLGELRVLTLNTLIGWYWIIGAGMTLGMKASDAEVQARIVQGNKQYFPKSGELARYLRLTGQTNVDLALRAKVQVFETKLLALQTAIEKRLPKNASDQQKRAALAKYEQSLPARRRVGGAKTSCMQGVRGFGLQAIQGHPASRHPQLTAKRCVRGPACSQRVA